MAGLNDAQRKAAEYAGGACLCLAGPGSGKTSVITSRIRYLIYKKKVPPEKILVITFTKDAAVSMERRFNGSENKIYPVVFGTFHSVFYNILRESRGYSSKKLLSDSYKKKILTKIISETIPDNNSEERKIYSGELAPEFISAFSIYKNTLDKKRACSRLEKKYVRFFDPVFEKYESFRSDKCLLDFDDMVYDCMILFQEDFCVRRKWQKRFEHILIDEYQDINRTQFDVVNLLKNENNSIFAVGDDDQAIYSFRGSDPSLLKAYETMYSPEIIRLEINYRSTRDIINLAGKIIGENRNRFAKKQFSSQKEEGVNSARTFFFSDREKQYAVISDRIKSLVLNGSCAVLFRTNMLMQGFATYLKKKNINFYIKENDLCIYDHPAAIDVFSYIELSENMFSDRIFGIINRPVRYISREALCSAGTQSAKYTPLDNAVRYYMSHIGEYNAEKRVKAAEKMIRDLEFIRDKPMFLRVSYIRKSIGLDGFYIDNFKSNKDMLDEYLSVLDFLSEDSQGFDSYDNWSRFVKLYKEEFNSSHKGKEKQDVCVKLMTVHASKGLEFDTVIIPDVNEGIFPHGKIKEASGIEEERRIFYVGVTRAKKRLLITAVSGTGEQPVKISRFLNVLNED